MLTEWTAAEDSQHDPLAFSPFNNNNPILNNNSSSFRTTTVSNSSNNLSSSSSSSNNMVGSNINNQVNVNNQISKQGYLFKKPLKQLNSNNFKYKFKSWKKRWFLLQKNSLLYFRDATNAAKYQMSSKNQKSSSSSQPLGVISLVDEDIKIEILNNEKNDYFGFKLITPYGHHLLAANSEKERKEWVESIVSVSGALQVNQLNNYLMKLQITILEAKLENIPNQVICKFKSNFQEFTTIPKIKIQNPIWNESFLFELPKLPLDIYLFLELLPDNKKITKKGFTKFTILDPDFLKNQNSRNSFESWLNIFEEEEENLIYNNLQQNTLQNNLQPNNNLASILLRMEYLFFDLQGFPISIKSLQQQSQQQLELTRKQSTKLLNNNEGTNMAIIDQEKEILLKQQKEEIKKKRKERRILMNRKVKQELERSLLERKEYLENYLLNKDNNNNNNKDIAVDQQQQQQQEEKKLLEEEEKKKKEIEKQEELKKLKREFLKKQKYHRLQLEITTHREMLNNEKNIILEILKFKKEKKEHEKKLEEKLEEIELQQSQLQQQQQQEPVIVNIDELLTQDLLQKQEQLQKDLQNKLKKEEKRLLKELNSKFKMEEEFKAKKLRNEINHLEKEMERKLQELQKREMETKKLEEKTKKEMKRKEKEIKKRMREEELKLLLKVQEKFNNNDNDETLLASLSKINSGNLSSEMLKEIEDLMNDKNKEMKFEVIEYETFEFKLIGIDIWSCGGFLFYYYIYNIGTLQSTENTLKKKMNTFNPKLRNVFSFEIKGRHNNNNSNVFFSTFHISGSNNNNGSSSSFVPPPPSALSIVNTNEMMVDSNSDNVGLKEILQQKDKLKKVDQLQQEKKKKKKKKSIIKNNNNNNGGGNLFDNIRNRRKYMENDDSDDNSSSDEDSDDYSDDDEMNGGSDNKVNPMLKVLRDRIEKLKKEQKKELEDEEWESQFGEGGTGGGYESNASSESGSSKEDDNDW